MVKKGVPISPGIAVARAYCVDEVLARQEPQQLTASGAADEIAHFENAVNATSAQLDTIITRVTQQLGEHEAAIFQAHRILLRDPALIGKVKTTIIKRQIDARTALHEALDEYTALFSGIQDEYIRERLTDIRDVVGRVMAQLAMYEAPQGWSADEPVILIAPEILPSQAVLLQKFAVVGIITEAGGGTGHAAILARSMGIPSVSGLVGVRREVATGDLVAMDGRDGHVYLRPDAETEAAYRKLQREYVHMRDRLIENRDQAPVTRDGTHVELLANVNNPADAEMACRTGATGVGLYRTEYLFLTHPNVPSEEEQLDAYRSVIEAAPNRKVTIRTLDIGGDKLVPYFGHEREANPFMGWRSIRLIASYPEFFMTQLRAIHRAAEFGEVELLFPMISTLEEVRHLKRFVQRTVRQLEKESGHTVKRLPLGVMLEVPSAALYIETLLPEVDFVSIGSNDLIQYVMAADRDNPKVAHLCEPFSPPVLRLLRHVIRACNRAGKSVTLCGEMAGRPRCFLPLFGMGLRKLSMSPAFVPTIKEVVRSTDSEYARRVARRVLSLATFQNVRRYLSAATRKICPNVTWLDTTK
jgi:phosphoenolpyruvate-protein phosphotransferase